MNRKKRILVVEDEPVSAMKLEHTLQQAGYTVQTAVDGLEALKVAHDFHPHIVISDIIMPNLDGYQLCRKIRETESLRKTLIILLTSHTDPGDVLEGLSVGADNFIVKPYEPKDLLARVEQILTMKSAHVTAGASTGIEIVYRGKQYIINANRLQVLNFFLTTYETQFRQFLDLMMARNELSALTRSLEEKVEQRTVALRQEIQDRRQAEQRIAEQAALLDLAHDGIIVTSMEGNILFWNKSAETLYGWSAEDTLGKNFGGMVKMGSTAPDTPEHTALLAHGAWSGEMIHHTREGAQVTVHSSWTLVRESNGQPKSILMINTDITQEKLLENKFLRTQRMENLGALAGGIAHDLNNVLAPILLATNLLKGKSTGESESKILTMVEESARRGADMVKQVLMFGRGMEGTKITLQPKHLIREMRQFIEQSFPKNIRLDVTTALDLPLVLGDATQLHQVLLNLCVNARDAMPNGGTLGISTDTVDLDAQYAASEPDASPGRYVLFTVSDTGIGMPPDVQEKIFEPFFTTKEIGKGTGLGLSTVHGIVRNHGGFIRLHSEVGKGTKFEVYFPTAVGGGTEQCGPVTYEERPGRGETILVVDDEAIVLEITRVTLEDNGYKVLTARDGTEALALYAKEGDRIDLVFTDVVMPYLDGASTIRALQKLNPRVKVIATSGLNTAEKVAGARTLMGVPLLEKPFTASALLARLGEMLD